MTCGASLLDEKLFAGNDRIRRGIGGTGKPSGILGGLHYSYPSAHNRVICAAILLAKKVIAPGLGGTKPHGVVVTGDNVHLDAEGGNRKVVNDVFAGEDELDVAPDRNVQ